ncbi:hypothetical protein AB4142_29945, partial [Variovorax sp. 2RAF20]
FRGVATKVFTVTFEGHAAASAAETAAAAELAGLRAAACDSLDDALARALALDPVPHVLICGSLYLAGEVLGADEAPRVGCLAPRSGVAGEWRGCCS